MPDNPPVRISKTHGSATEVLSDHPNLTSDSPGSSNAASNGYWIHDDLGPKQYVAPPEDNGMDVSEGDLVTRIDAALHANSRLDPSRMHVALEEGAVIVNGIAVSATERQLAGDVVKMVVGELPVINRLLVDEGLNKNRVSP